MAKVIKIDKIPEYSLILNGIGDIDYCDSYQIEIITTSSIDKITTGIFNVPEWVKLLLQVRNSIVRLFGLKTGETQIANIADYYPVGSKAVYFTVSDRNETEIVMNLIDAHLNFRTSVMLVRKEFSTTISLMTIVKFNNKTGRIYFFLIKPFHKIIIKSLLKRLILID